MDLMVRALAIANCLLGDMLVTKCLQAGGQQMGGAGRGGAEEFRIILFRSVYWTGLLCLPLILV